MAAKKEASHLTMTANIDRKVFTDFALFDTFVMKKRWKNPVLFASIMILFSVICFAARKSHEQAGLLGTVLLSVGLVLPAVWFLLFMISVQNQVKVNRLSSSKAQYFVMLSEENVRVAKGEERVEHNWDEIYHVYLMKGCIYLYISQARAYLMPQCGDTDAAISLISSKVPADKISDRR